MISFPGAPLAFWPITIVRYEFEMHETLVIVHGKMRDFALSKPHSRIFLLLVESLGRVYNFGFIN